MKSVELSNLVELEAEIIEEWLSSGEGPSLDLEVNGTIAWAHSVAQELVRMGYAAAAYQDDKWNEEAGRCQLEPPRILVLRFQRWTA